MGRRHPRRIGTAGLNTIELMVVLVVIGVLVAIAAPIYAKYVRNSRLSEATGRLGELLTAARSYAAAHDENVGPEETMWPESCDAPGFLGNCTESKNFTFHLTGVPSGSIRVEAIGKPETPVEGVKVVIEIEEPEDRGLPAVFGI